MSTKTQVEQAKILEALHRHNGSASVVSLLHECGIPKTTLYRRIKEMDECILEDGVVLIQTTTSNYSSSSTSSTRSNYSARSTSSTSSTSSNSQPQPHQQLTAQFHSVPKPPTVTDTSYSEMGGGPGEGGCDGRPTGTTGTGGTGETDGTTGTGGTGETDGTSSLGGTGETDGTTGTGGTWETDGTSSLGGTGETDGTSSLGGTSSLDPERHSRAYQQRHLTLALKYSKQPIIHPDKWLDHAIKNGWKIPSEWVQREEEVSAADRAYQQTQEMLRQRAADCQVHSHKLAVWASLASEDKRDWIRQSIRATPPCLRVKLGWINSNAKSMYMDWCFGGQCDKDIEHYNPPDDEETMIDRVLEYDTQGQMPCSESPSLQEKVLIEI